MNVIGPDRPVMSTNYAVLLSQLVERWGVERSQLLAGTNIKETSLHDPDGFITYSQYQPLILNALALTKEPALGLHFGKRLNISTHGLLGYAVMACPSLEQAAALAIKYINKIFVT